MARIGPAAKVVFCLLIGTLLIAACDAPLQQTTGNQSPTATSEPTATTQPTINPSPTNEQATRENGLPPYLLRVTPEARAVVGLDLRLCATFDVTGDGMPGWDGPIWFEMAGIEEERPANVVDRYEDTTEHGGCSSTLRHLLNEGDLASVPTAGPLEVAVHYLDEEGMEHRHAWEVTLNLAAPEAPEEVRRIRQVYRPIQAIDAGRNFRELTIAGYFLEGDILNVYLLDNADPETVRMEVEAALGDAVPHGGIRLMKLESPPDARQLNTWIEEVQDPIWSTEGIRLHIASGGCCNIWDRVMFGVGTAYSAHLIREAVAQTSVPQEAVFIGVDPRPKLKEPSTGLHNIDTTLEFDPVAQRGKVLRVDVVWANLGDSPVEVGYNPNLPFDLIVLTPEGEAVWDSHGGGPVALPLVIVDLAPGEEHRFTRYWELVDQDGFAVPPGDYLVQAQGDFLDETREGDDRFMSLVTETYPLRIEP